MGCTVNLNFSFFVTHTGPWSAGAAGVAVLTCDAERTKENGKKLRKCVFLEGKDLLIKKRALQLMLCGP